MGPAPAGAQDRGTAGEPEVGELFWEERVLSTCQRWQRLAARRRGARRRSLLEEPYSTTFPVWGTETVREMEPGVIWIEAVKLIELTPSRAVHLEVEET